MMFKKGEKMEKMSLITFLTLNELELSSVELTSDDSVNYLVLDSGEVIEIVKEVTE